MNTQEQILTRLSDLQVQREAALNEVKLVDGVISFWEQRLDTLKQEQLSTVHPTYTDTPMAEEYYGG